MQISSETNHIFPFNQMSEEPPQKSLDKDLGKVPKCLFECGQGNHPTFRCHTYFSPPNPKTLAVVINKNICITCLDGLTEQGELNCKKMDCGFITSLCKKSGKYVRKEITCKNCKLNGIKLNYLLCPCTTGYDDDDDDQGGFEDYQDSEDQFEDCNQHDEENGYENDENLDEYGEDSQDEDQSGGDSGNHHGWHSNYKTLPINNLSIISLPPLLEFTKTPQGVSGTHLMKYTIGRGQSLINYCLTMDENDPALNTNKWWSGSHYSCKGYMDNTIFSNNANCETVKSSYMESVKSNYIKSVKSNYIKTVGSYYMKSVKSNYIKTVGSSYMKSVKSGYIGTVGSPQYNINCLWPAVNRTCTIKTYSYSPIDRGKQLWKLLFTSLISAATIVLRLMTVNNYILLSAFCNTATWLPVPVAYQPPTHGSPRYRLTLQQQLTVSFTETTGQPGDQQSAHLPCVDKEGTSSSLCGQNWQVNFPVWTKLTDHLFVCGPNWWIILLYPQLYTGGC